MRSCSSDDSSVVWRSGARMLEYRTLFEERLIGPELYTALRRELRDARATVDVRPGWTWAWKRAGSSRMCRFSRA